MIRKFQVKNFKNFKDWVVLDFSKIHDYGFNEDLIKDGLVNKMLIYGPNNSGKSNLGAAVMDLTQHLTENFGKNNPLYAYYLNGDSTDDYVDFKYEFLLQGKIVNYEYRKNSQMKLLYEELSCDNQLLLKYNYETNKFENNIPDATTIDFSKRNTETSALKYAYTNTMYWTEDSPVKLMMEFVNNMLWFRSLRENEFMGVMANSEDLNDFIINNRLVSEFEQFLHEFGQNYNLCVVNDRGKQVIGVKYKNAEGVFGLVASTGTKALWLFFYWMKRTPNISFVYLDEFDAFYHYELSSNILSYVNKRPEFQSVLTSHNTYLIDNGLMRPDCYALLKDGKISSFADSTTKVIRQAHNLEKMMLGGEFDK